VKPRSISLRIQRIRPSGNYVQERKRSAHLVHLRPTAAAAPTPPFAFFLDVHDNFHAAAFKELDGALTDVENVGGAGGDDVDYAEDAGFVGCVGVVMAVVVCMAVLVCGGVKMGMVVPVVMRLPMVVCMRVAMVVYMRVAMVVCMRVAMVVCVRMVMVMCVIVCFVAMTIFVVVSAVWFLHLLSMRFSMGSALIFEPESGDCVPNDAPQRSEFAKCVPNTILQVVWQAQHEPGTTALH
jgi:hypothetical protein